MNVEAILVLGCGVTPAGEPSDSARASVRLGLEQFQRLKPNWLIMSGGFSHRADFRPVISEAQAMKDYAVSLAAPAKQVLTEAESKNTLENALFTKLNLLIPLNIRTIVVIAGPGHTQKRLKYIFGKVMGEDYTCEFVMHPGPDSPQKLQREQRSLEKLRSGFDDIADGDTLALYHRLRELHAGRLRD
jgi:uncharacterized SAM-binding protein YcdF (DUF218 family)